MPSLLNDTPQPGPTAAPHPPADRQFLSLSGSGPGLLDNPQFPADKPQPGPSPKLSAEEAFVLWKKDPTPKAGSQLLVSLRPAIDQGLRVYAGPSPTAADRSAAKQLALHAAETYEPGRSNIKTHVNNHLKRLQRIRGQRYNVLGTSERRTLARNALLRRQVELADELGREPSMAELADFTATPIGKLKKMLAVPAAANTGYLAESAELDGGSGESGVEQDEEHFVLEAIYSDLPAVNQRIMELTLGMHGEKPLSNQEIAKRVKLSPGAVSQRKAAIQSQIDRLQDTGVFR